MTAPFDDPLDIVGAWLRHQRLPGQRAPLRLSGHHALMTLFVGAVLFALVLAAFAIGVGGCTCLLASGAR
jgi:hypothetical protein